MSRSVYQIEDQEYQRNMKSESRKVSQITLLSLLLGLVLLLIFLGLGPLSERLGSAPTWFIFYWVIVFVLAFLLPAFAIHSLALAHHLHRKRLRELDKELAVAAEDVRTLINSQKTNSSDSKNL